MIRWQSAWLALCMSLAGDVYRRTTKPLADDIYWRIAKPLAGNTCQLTPNCLEVLPPSPRLKRGEVVRMTLESN